MNDTEFMRIRALEDAHLQLINTIRSWIQRDQLTRVARFEALDEWAEEFENELRISPLPDHEPTTPSPNDLSDDAEALASAGRGTDEDYGGGSERI